MAISEACQLWIEQRVNEELEGKAESGKSLRAIGREIADEIEKYFEASVKPETITMKASRMQGVTNVTPEPTPQNETEKGGNSGNKITPVRIAQEVKKEMSHASSEREAERRVANKIGRPENSVHVTHQREKAKRKGVQNVPNPETLQKFQISDAMLFADMAISQLERINQKDPERMEAFSKVKRWIEKEMEG